MTEETNHEPDWPEDLREGAELAECIIDLLIIHKHDPGKVACALGYFYTDGQGHRHPLVDHLMKAIKEAGVDLQTAKKSELGRPTYDLSNMSLCRTTDNGTNVWITKKTYEKYRELFNKATSWEEDDFPEITPEPVMTGWITHMRFVQQGEQQEDDFTSKEDMQFYGIDPELILC